MSNANHQILNKLEQTAAARERFGKHIPVADSKKIVICKPAAGQRLGKHILTTMNTQVKIR
jgi:hypothetical protein